MQYDRMLAELFGEEDRARAMATRLAEIAHTSPEAASSERESLIAFLRGPVERHFRYEELSIFPMLEKHDLGPEVQVALKHHEEVRQLAEELAAAKQGDVGELIFKIARLLLHHTNFEGDYIYPELTHDEWRELMKESVEIEAGTAPNGSGREGGDSQTPSRAGHDGGDPHTPGTAGAAYATNPR